MHRRAHWIALQWLPEGDGPAGGAPDPQALAWWALRHTPHVAWVEEALLLEVGSVLRLWGGARALGQRLAAGQPLAGMSGMCMRQAHAGSSLAALARLRLRVQGESVPPELAALPLHTLSAARPHLDWLQALGCHRWGDVAALPRAQLAQRLGPALGQALERALGQAPDLYPWARLPDRFAQGLALPQRADTALALLWGAARLLERLQQWLCARQLGVLVLELSWRHDRRRLDGRPLPATDALELRSARPEQHMARLRRLLAERLERTRLQAPAVAIRLRALHTEAWPGESASLLPAAQQVAGDALALLIERLGARLGEGGVRVAELQAEHRPERRQRWHPAAERLMAEKRKPGAAPPPVRCGLPDALAPTQLLPEPLPLTEREGQPRHHGPLQLLSGPHRIEAGWWPPSDAVGTADTAPAASRDYYIARNPRAELLWVFQQRPTRAAPGGAWFLQGRYV